MDEQIENLIPEEADYAPEEETQPQEPTPAQPEAPTPELPTARDYASEVAALLQAHPELRGRALPDDVTRAAVDDGLPLVEAYRSYAERETKAELERLRAENRVYRQNEEAARRAPIQPVADSGVQEKARDPFLVGFESW